MAAERGVHAVVGRLVTMTPKGALAFVKRRGIVLEAGHGSVPSLAERIVGKQIRGSWWAHPDARTIFRLTRAVRESRSVLVCRLVDGKVTYVHRRLWPALTRVARKIGTRRLAAIREEHTPSGAHRIVTTPFPRWVPRDVKNAAGRLSERLALARLNGIRLTAGRGIR